MRGPARRKDRLRRIARHRFQARQLQQPHPPPAPQSASILLNALLQAADYTPAPSPSGVLVCAGDPVAGPTLSNRSRGVR